ncbi:MAG: hypothetical protein K2N19_01640 [Muribaculaceae bacterium]|nr:hypothetical protein [Muribaculaceae bacterium]
MKKKFYLPLGLAALALLGTGCTAEDPANGLDINQTIYVDHNGGSTENPLTRYRISSYDFNGGQYRFDYRPSGAPVEVAKGGNTNTIFRIEYAANMDYPSAVEWSTETYVYEDEVYRTVANHKIENLEFEGGLLKSLIYSGNIVSYEYKGEVIEGVPYPSHDVKFEYDGAGHLVKILVDDKAYEQKWDAAGDLTEINSPWFGTSMLEYSEVGNRYGQWDPTLPFMGFFQAFGWFGTAPVHFPKTISTKALSDDPDASSGSRAAAEVFTLDYYLDYNGLMEQVAWARSTNNGMSVYINYISL